METFTRYWDEVIQDWFCGIIDTEQQHYGELVNPNYLPEPYIGNPRQCSFVIVNYNAGGGDNRDPMIYKDCAGCPKNTESLISYVKRRSYSEVMTSFPYLLTEDELAKRGLKGIENYCGYKWWQAKIDWINHVAKVANVPTIDDGLMPFAIELCAWHSKSWSDTEVLLKNDNLKSVLKRYVVDVVIQTVILSEAHFAYFIGKKHIPVLKALGFLQIGGDAENSIGKKGNNRFFAIFAHKFYGTRVVVTWTLGNNRHPGKSYYEKESSIIQRMLRDNNKVIFK